MEINDDEEGDRAAESPSESPAASPGPAADWAQAARRGQRLTDLTAAAAASQQHSRPEKHSAGGRNSTGVAPCQYLYCPLTPISQDVMTLGLDRRAVRATGLVVSIGCRCSTLPMEA